MRLLFDLEANGLLKPDTYKGIPAATKVWCICVQDVDTGHEYTFGPDELPQALTLLSQADMLIGHNIQEYDIPVLKKLLGWKKPKGVQVYDTLIVSRLWWTDLASRDKTFRDKGNDFPAGLVGRHSLKAWGYRLGLLKGEFAEEDGAFAAFTPDLLDYCLQDVRVNRKLWDLMQKQDIPSLALTIEHKFAHVIQSIMDAGVGFDKRKGEELEKDLAVEQARLVSELRNIFPPRVEVMKTPQWFEIGEIRFTTKTEPKRLLVRGEDAWSLPAIQGGFPTRKAAEEWIDSNIVEGPPREKLHPFNPGSASDIAYNLTKKYGWKPKKFGKNGIPIMDEGMMKSLPYPECKKLAELKIVEKRLQMLSSGNTAYLSMVRENDRIYGYVNHNGTQTHRCTHSGPNLGQVPKRDKDPIYGDRFRELFIPRKGWKMLGADLSGLEIRCLANRLNNRKFTETVLEGDIHSMNQQALGFESRSKTKNWFYAYLYGAGDQKLGAMAGGKKPLGTQLRAQFESRIPGLGAFVKKVKQQAKTGYLTAIDGRRVPIRSDHSALNFQLQSDGAIASKVATFKFFEEAEKVAKRGRDWNLFLHVHDEFQAELKPDLVDEFTKIALACFSWAGEYLGFTLPLAGDVQCGDSWKETH